MSDQPMTEPVWDADGHLTVDAVLARLDGLALTPDAADHLVGCATCQQLSDDLGATTMLVRDVPGAPDGQLDHSLAVALAEFDGRSVPGPLVAVPQAVAPLATVTELAGRRMQRLTRVLAAAAALTVVAVGIGSVVRSGQKATPVADQVASKAQVTKPTPAAAEVQEAAGGGNEPSDATEAAAMPSAVFDSPEASSPEASSPEASSPDANSADAPSAASPPQDDARAAAGATAEAAAEPPAPGPVVSAPAPLAPVTQPPRTASAPASAPASASATASATAKKSASRQPTVARPPTAPPSTALTRAAPAAVASASPSFAALPLPELGEVSSLATLAAALSSPTPSAELQAGTAATIAFDAWAPSGANCGPALQSALGSTSTRFATARLAGVPVIVGGERMADGSIRLAAADTVTCTVALQDILPSAGTTTAVPR